MKQEGMEFEEWADGEKLAGTMRIGARKAWFAVADVREKRLLELGKSMQNACERATELRNDAEPSREAVLEELCGLVDGVNVYLKAECAGLYRRHKHYGKGKEKV